MVIEEGFNEDVEVEDNSNEDSNEEIVDTEQEESSEDEEQVEEQFSVAIEGEQEESEEEIQKKDPNWLSNLRKRDREAQRKIKELEAKLTTTQKPVISKIGAKPKLDDADVDYDTEKYETKLANWFESKRKVDEEEAKKEESVKKQQLAWQNKLSTYNENKIKLPVKDFKEIEDEVGSTLSLAQQSVIIKVADNPALLVYALGKNKKALDSVSSISDLVEFSAAISKLETKLKTTTSKGPSTLPEKVPTGSGKKPISADKELERLRAEAEKSGDMSKVIAYKNKLRQK